MAHTLVHMAPLKWQSPTARTVANNCLCRAAGAVHSPPGGAAAGAQLAGAGGVPPGPLHGDPPVVAARCAASAPPCTAPSLAMRCVAECAECAQGLPEQCSAPAPSSCCAKCTTSAPDKACCCCAESMRGVREQWVAAAVVLQGGVRRWQSRRALASALAAISRGVAALRTLQAMWRGRLLRAQFLRQRAATLTVQVQHVFKVHGASVTIGCHPA